MENVRNCIASTLVVLYKYYVTFLGCALRLSMNAVKGIDSEVLHRPRPFRIPTCVAFEYRHQK